jgi:predicted nucleic acid-binding protein
MRNNPNNVFIDTNVLVGAYGDNDTDKKCLQYLYSLKGKRLFISSLSVAQLVSIFQKKKTNREIKQIVQDLFCKFTIVSFVQKDIENAMRLEYSDMEDCIQYEISSKVKCGTFVTNNIKDYRVFTNINIMKPIKIRTIEQ